CGRSVKGMKHKLIITCLTFAASSFSGVALDLPKSLVAHELDTDKGGNVYILGGENADTNAAIYKYDSQGTYLDAIEGLSKEEIYSFAVDRRNANVYFSAANSIWRATPSAKGYKIEIFYVSEIPLGRFRIAIDTDGNVYAEFKEVITKIAGGYAPRVVVREEVAPELLGVDSKGCIIYSAAKKLWKASPPASPFYTREEIPTTPGAASDAIAFDANDNLFIADHGRGTIRKHNKNGTESVLPSHYGDLKALTIDGDTLYIANGIAGVSRVDPKTGWCSGVKLVSLEKGSNYFARTKNGHYYISFPNRLLEYDDKGNKLGTIWEGKSKILTGVALDGRDNLLFNLNRDLEPAIYWRQAEKPESRNPIESAPLYALSVRQSDAYVCTGTKSNDIRLCKLDPEQNLIAETGFLITKSNGIKGLAAGKEEGVFFIDGNSVLYARDANPFSHKVIIQGLVQARALTVDVADPDVLGSNQVLFVTNEGHEPHIGKYTSEGRHLSDLVHGSMKDLRDLVVVEGDLIVLQADGVWKYSNTFVKNK
ncbi:MAG TPA: hypothetical protein VIS99_05230, partial [Terrimicrobiaceae bacterium]